MPPLLLALALPFFVHAEADEPPVRDPSERIHSLAIDYEIHRDGSVTFAQRFRLGVAGVAVKRGPVLNYLTVFEGLGGLILDNELEILEVTRGGRTEPHRLDRGDGFATLYIGTTDLELPLGVHDYLVRGRTQADWRKHEGEFSAVFDIVGPFATFPIEAASTTIRLPEGVVVSRYSPAVTGVEAPQGRSHFESVLEGNVLTVQPTGPLGENRSFFVNLAWPSGTFAVRSQWPLVLRQHPRLPLAGFSALLLIWALMLLLKRMASKSEEAS